MPLLNDAERAARTELRSDEELVRSDVVIQWHGSTAWSFTLSRRLSIMHITSRRVLFRPPSVPAAYAAIARLNQIASGDRSIWFVPPLASDFEFRLAQLEKLSKWAPEFVVSPGLWVNGQIWTFKLMRDRFPWLREAPRTEVRAHFDALDAARTKF
jgi:hypothetical protein